MTNNENWYLLENPERIPSPALLIYPDRVRNNIDLMIRIAGDVKRLRPHVKTHKLPELVALQLSCGIKKFKCSTIAEAEMTAENGGQDVLLAYQPVGPHIERFFQLKRAFPEVSFSTLVDNTEILKQLTLAAEKNEMPFDLYVDIDNGMHRTGIGISDGAFDLIKKIRSLPVVSFAGLHVYDGHIHESDPNLREKECRRDFKPVVRLIRKLKDLGIEVPHLVAGGTPTFPIHAKFQERELSPGTPLLWDMGYSSSFSDLKFQHAAVLLSRVISQPQDVNLCLDLGYKAVSADKSHPRVSFFGVESFTTLNQSEEHLVIHPAEESGLVVGDVVYGIPAHICPTVALYDDAHIVENHKCTGSWKIVGRTRKITV